MATINEKIKDCNRWIPAEKDLKEFYKTMELIRQYPTKPIKPAPQAPPYETSLY